VNNINNLISYFSVDELKLFFRSKIAKFKPIEESYDFLFEDKDEISDNFTYINKIGEAVLNNNDDLLIITAKTNKILTNRTGKKRQYEIAKNILKEENNDAAFFIFYDENNNFRFSFIRANFLGTKRDFTNFKRYTYFVSKEQTNKTFISQISKADFKDLDSIQDAFSVEPLTKQFYEKLQHWYFWAIDNVKFPKDAEEEKNGREIAIIRLITRLMFIWFMKVRELVPENLFDEENIKNILENFADEDSTFYKAILQNLFFATLNTKQVDRKFRSETRGHKGFNPDFGNQNVFRYHDLFKDPESLKTLFEKIPFLNGGLFECLDYKPRGKEKDENKYIDGFTATKGQQPIVPNFLFFSEPQKKDISKFYGKKNKTYEVEGLINLLKSYNFTIDENEANDIEVALDPELLGSIFENLLASYNPETATTARKATGSFYTPREIVNYMTNESLKQYFLTHLAETPQLDGNLDTLIKSNNLEHPFDETTSKKITRLIDNLRVVDPAVGSGAFPMAVLNKLVFILSKIDPDNIFWKNSQLEGIKKAVKDPVLQRDIIAQTERRFQEKNADYGRKLYLIEKCIYGVDIQQIAVEIAKLRFFISLLVDEKIKRDEPENNFGIEPLPNLDFKLMQGNSLISSFAGIDFDKTKKQNEENLFDLDESNTELIKEFEELKNEYQNESEKEKKDNLRDKIENCIFKIVEDKIAPQLRSIEEKYAKFSNKKILIDKKNKIYITKQEAIAQEKQLLGKKLGYDIMQIEKDLKAFTEGRKPKDFFLWKIYFAEVFSQKGGFDIVIGNPPYIDHKHLKQISPLLMNYKTYNGKNDLFVYFYEKGLNLTKKDAVLCFITSNKWIRSEYGRNIRNYFLKKANPLILIDFGINRVFDATVDCNIILIQNSKNNNTFKICKISGKFTKNSNISDYLYQNLIPNLKLSDNTWLLLGNEASQLKEKIEYKGIPLSEFSVKIYRGIGNGLNKAFIIDSKKKNELIEVDEMSIDIIKPLVKGNDIEKFNVNWRNLYLIFSHRSYDITKYKAIYAHLMKYKSELERRLNVVRDGEKWWQIPYAISYKDCFFKEKILWRSIAKKIEFSYDTKGYFPDVTTFIMSGKNLKFFVSILNSKLFEYALIEIYLEGDTFKSKNKIIQNFPVPKIQDSLQKPYEALVDQIISQKELGEDTKELEDKIDIMVYKLYELTYEEVKIVDSEFWLSKEEYENFEIKEQGEIV